MHKQIIEINGHHYDAVSGILLTTDGILPRATAEDHDAQANTHFSNVRRTAPKAHVKTVTEKPKAKAAHPVKPSTTLMRSAVKKPAPAPIHVQHVLPETPPPIAHTVDTKKSVSSVNYARLERAQSTARSEKVSRFQAGEKSKNFATQYAHVPVQIAPEKPEETVEPVPAPERTNNPLDMFSEALAQASNFVDVKAHSAAYRKHARRHFASMAVGVTALLALIGFAAYINTPDLQIRVAGMRAGVSTASIDFDKAGFAYTGVSATPTKRVIGLSKGAASYRLTEEATNWDGETMIKSVSSVHANGSPNYTTVKAGKSTVYRFGKTEATWVKNGTWYTLSGNSVVSDSQLRSLVQNS